MTPRPLIVRLRNWVGDVILGVPALHLLQQNGSQLELLGKGWARSLLPMKGQSALFPPDKPPTVVYRSMPGQYIPPFSYKHPVTGKPLTDLPQAVDSVTGRK